MTSSSNFSQCRSLLNCLFPRKKHGILDRVEYNHLNALLFHREDKHESAIDLIENALCAIAEAKHKQSFVFKQIELRLLEVKIRLVSKSNCLLIRRTRDFQFLRFRLLLIVTRNQKSIVSNPWKNNLLFI